MQTHSLKPKSREPIVSQTIIRDIESVEALRNCMIKIDELQ